MSLILKIGGGSSTIEAICLPSTTSQVGSSYKQKILELILQRILPEILSGQKRICLAITEPAAGSDVRNVTTTAEKTADGKHYIVNGEKKISFSIKDILVLQGS
jgi:alkylation response protein AidB-like acyl-CoA dehydrogenase